MRNIDSAFVIQHPAFAIQHFTVALVDPPAPDHDITFVEHHCLSGRDG
jgi:hypothetical protein